MTYYDFEKVISNTKDECRKEYDELTEQINQAYKDNKPMYEIDAMRERAKQLNTMWGMMIKLHKNYLEYTTSEDFFNRLKE